MQTLQPMCLLVRCLLLMSCCLGSEMYRSLCASASRPEFANIVILSICVCIVYNSLCWVHSFMNPHSALDCLFWQFFVEAPYSPPLLDPAPVFLLYSGRVRRRDVRLWTTTQISTVVKNTMSINFLLQDINSYLFIPLLMEISQQDVSLLCDNDCGQNSINTDEIMR